MTSGKLPVALTLTGIDSPYPNSGIPVTRPLPLIKIVKLSGYCTCHRNYKRPALQRNRSAGFNIKTAIAILSGLLLNGCGQTSNTSMPIVPCHANISAMNFNSDHDMLRFAKLGLPLGSNELCARQAFNGSKMRFVYQEIQPNGDNHVLFRETEWGRPKYIFSIGYDARSVHLDYHEHKLYKIVVN